MKTEAQLLKLENLIDLAKKQGADEIEVIKKSWTDNPVNFENNRLKILESKETSGISIRIIKNNKMSLASSTDENALESLVNSVVELSEYGSPAIFNFTKDKLDLTSTEERQPPLPLETLVEKGTSIIESLKTFHKDLLISGGFNLGYGETTYLNSNGVHGKRKKTVYHWRTQSARNELCFFKL